MKEKFLTLTALNFTSEGKLLGRGCAITAGATLEEAVLAGAVQMGAFHSAVEELPSRCAAVLERCPGMTLTFAGSRFLLAGVKAPASRKRLFRFG